jgi:hypothetical protein
MARIPTPLRSGEKTILLTFPFIELPEIDCEVNILVMLQPCDQQDTRLGQNSDSDTTEIDPRKSASSVLSALRFWVFVQSGDIRIHEHRRKYANSEQLRRFAAVMMVIAATAI